MVETSNSLSVVLTMTASVLLAMLMLYSLLPFLLEAYPGKTIPPQTDL